MGETTTQEDCIWPTKLGDACRHGQCCPTGQLRGPDCGAVALAQDITEGNASGGRTLPFGSQILGPGQRLRWTSGVRTRPASATSSMRPGWSSGVGPRDEESGRSVAEGVFPEDPNRCLENPAAGPSSIANPSRWSIGCSTPTVVTAGSPTGALRIARSGDVSRIPRLRAWISRGPIELEAQPEQQSQHKYADVGPLARRPDAAQRRRPRRSLWRVAGQGSGRPRGLASVSGPSATLVRNVLDLLKRPGT